MRGIFVKLFATACLLLLAVMAPAQINEKAEELVRQIRATANPTFDPSRSGDPAYLKSHKDLVKAAIRKRGQMIFSLFRMEPEHPALAELFAQRWQELEALGDTEQEIMAVLQAGIKETEDLLLPPQNISGATIWPQDDWHQVCRYWRARMVIRMNMGNWPAQLGVVKDYIQEAPLFPATHSDLLLQAAFVAPSPQQAAEAYRMIVQNYPQDPLLPTVKGFLKRIDGVGQPAFFTITDLTTKKEVKTESLKGSFLIIDFFRLNSPALAERVKTLKELKAAHGKDLTIISICLDQASGTAAKVLEDKVRQWAASEKIDWVVAAPAEKAQVDFIQAWRFTALPEAFYINKAGVLVKLGYGLDLKKEASELLKQ